MERLLGQRRDDDPVDGHPELAEGVREQVVGQRPLWRDALQPHRDRVRLPGPDPDGQVPLAVELLEDDDVLAGGHVHANALDDHLHELFRHGRIIPRLAGRAARGSWRLEASMDGQGSPTGRSSRATRPAAIPTRNPPIWAKMATPPPVSGIPSEASPSISWSANHRPRTRSAGTSTSWKKNPKKTIDRTRAPGNATR